MQEKPCVFHSMLSVLAICTPVCVVLPLKQASNRLEDDHNWALRTPAGCECIYYSRGSFPSIQAPFTPAFNHVGDRKPSAALRGQRLLITATSHPMQSDANRGPLAMLSPQSSSSLPEATLSSMASRMAFSSNTGPCPSHLARCFSRLLMSAMSTKPLLYRSWLIM